MFGRRLCLNDIIKPENWKSIQDYISEALEVSIRTFSHEGDLLYDTRRPCRLWKDLTKKKSSPKEILSFCLLKSNINNIKHIRKEIGIKCPLGLDNFIVPIRAVGDIIVAYMLIGPLMLKRRINAGEYAQAAEQYGISAAELADALIEIKVLSYSKADSVVNLIKSVFSYMAQTGYQKKRLGKIGPEIAELDPLFSRYYEEEILSSLLKLCTQALDAHSGSVMTLDKKSNMLHIKVASRLDEDIVNNTNIKLGEGIAGVAAATSTPIILPQDNEDKSLSLKLNRQYIKSSMVVPFHKGDSHKVYGVINLNMVRNDQEFTEKDIALVKELVSMASIALIPLRRN